MAITLTKEELLAYLKKSSLNTILVEGKEDASIYRWIENELTSDCSFDLLPCDGRDTLLDIFEKKHEINDIKLLFIADKDKFVYREVPDKYKDIIWTSGYSIENDLYFGGYLEALLTEPEKIKFQKGLANFIMYYSHDVEKVKRGIDSELRYHPNQILDTAFDLIKTNNCGFDVSETINQLTGSYQLLIRGKSLFSLLFLILCDKNRPIKHKKSSLMEVCLKCNENNLVRNIIMKIKEELQLPT
ncbi:DUF4435 domain-containing protein [Terrimonas pollutisoli]|uniref:DUF4435 domain-containing protein n=1 Tax=Terrimonas pollutisoli TaxID=3034147 RepID=UPI0023EDA7DD|nr:DUF4435 domain-containing protein [Terrimonas sp. H1YJ31]